MSYPLRGYVSVPCLQVCRHLICDICELAACAVDDAVSGQVG